MDGRQDIIELLHKGNYSCVIAKGNDIRTFNQRGIKDLLEQLDCDPAFLRGASIADKVVGKAAAALIAAGGILSVYADTISLSALCLLEKSHIPTEFGNLVPYIRNHTGSDWCPMEKLCYGIASINDILDAIQRFLTKKMNHEIKFDNKKTDTDEQEEYFGFTGRLPDACQSIDGAERHDADCAELCHR